MSGVSARELIRNYGQIVRVKKGSEESFKETKAFIQPLRSNDKKTLYGNYLGIGADNDGMYLYIGTPNVSLDEYPLDTIVYTKNRSYVVKSDKKICISDDVIYIRAILQVCSNQD